jgi:hypothetical protein
MAASRATSQANPKRVVSGPRARPSRKAAMPPSKVHRSVLEGAQRAGLLSGDKSEHVSFRAPPALIEAAKRETGVSSTTELGLLALAMLAQPDPVVAYMKRNRGKLGTDHTLDY